jgi:hypothetical protein
MIVKAKYHKEIEITDDISEEEINRICQYGMPDRFDCMADEMDNVQPLEFSSWSYVEDKYYKPNDQLKQSEELTNVVKKQKIFQNILKWLMPVIFAIVFGIAWGIIKHNVVIGLLTAGIYIVVWVPVTAIVNWVRKVNKFMEGDGRNV